MSFWGNRGGIEIFLLIGIVIFSVFLAGGISTQSTVDLSPSQNQQVNVDTSASVGTSSAQELQLKTFTGIIVTPPPIAAPPPVDVPPGDTSNPITPSNPCDPDSGQPMPAGCGCSYYVVSCASKTCTSIITPNGQPMSCDGNTVGPLCNSDRTSSGDGSYCLAKPVIYLYPTSPTNVSVKIQTNGKITISDPSYENGWDNVLVFPSGNLIYKNNVYKELFYETNAADIKRVDGGIIVETKDIKQELYDLTSKLGLIQKEQDELVDWWTPRLQALSKKYILISLVDKETKNKTDKVLISPEPNTRIEFILYFKGLDQKINVPSLDLPNTPQRKGFTEVEWGGTIER